MLIRLRQEKAPPAQKLDPEDPVWAHVPRPDKIIILVNDEGGNTITHLGINTSEKIRLISKKGNELEVDEYIEKSGNQITLDGREYKTSAVAVFKESNSTIIRFIPNYLLEDIREIWGL